jgi:hypothetical protein
MAEIIEYPKAQYRNGEYMAVADRDEEDAAAADGWTDWHSDQERIAHEAETSGAPALDREKLKVMAKSLGLEFPNFIKTEALAALVSDAVKA